MPTYLYSVTTSGWRHGGVVASTVASRNVSRFTARGFWVRTHWPTLALACPPCVLPVFSGYSVFLPQSKDMQVRLNCPLSLYVGPVTDWRPVQGVAHRSPSDSWDRLQHPRNPVNNGWMDGPSQD